MSNFVSSSSVKLWDKQSRIELKIGFEKSMKLKCSTMNDLINHVIKNELNLLDLANITISNFKPYSIPKSNINDITKTINKVISSWKGLQRQRFTKDETLNKESWMKKAKGWQFQNQWKVEQHLWSLILKSASPYIKSISFAIYTQNNHQNALFNVLFSKVIQQIFETEIRFKKTRLTPILSARVLTNSFSLQDLLKVTDESLKVYQWKKKFNDKKKLRIANAKKNNKTKKKDKTPTVATLVHCECQKHANLTYKRNLESFTEIFPESKIHLSSVQHRNDPLLVMRNYNKSEDHSDLDSIPFQNESFEALNNFNPTYSTNTFDVLPPTINNSFNEFDDMESTGYGGIHGVSNYVITSRYSPMEYNNINNNNKSNEDNIRYIRIRQLETENSELKREINHLRGQIQIESPWNAPMMMPPWLMMNMKEWYMNMMNNRNHNNYSTKYQQHPFYQ